MALGKVTTYPDLMVQKPREVDLPDGDAPQVGNSGREAAAGPDCVEFSRGSREVAKVTKVMMDRNELRTEKVDRIRNLIENKLYKIEPEKIAEKMLEETL